MTYERQCRRCGSSYDVRGPGCNRCGLLKPIAVNEASVKGLPPGHYDAMLDNAGQMVVIGETGRMKH